MEASRLVSFVVPCLALFACAADVPEEGVAPRIESDARLARGWSSLPPLPGPGVLDHGVAVTGGKLYVIGGFRTDVLAYDLAAATWSRVAPLPAPFGVHHPNVAAVNGKLYVVGTLLRDPRGVDSPSGAVWIYDPSTNVWRNGTPMPDRSTWRGAAAVATIGSTIFVAGGYKANAGQAPMRTVQAYDTALDRWETLPPLPLARHHVMAASVDSRLYVVGGESSNQVFDRLEVYDPRTRTWQTRKSMPTPRSGASVGVIDGVIVVAGGNDEHRAPMILHSAVEAYDPATDAWSSLAPMTHPRHAVMGVASSDGVLYVPGGGDTAANPSASTIRFDAFRP
jgi:N-acetylneuraminic acid mutarotase